MAVHVLCVDAKQTSRFVIDDRFEEGDFAYFYREVQEEGGEWVQTDRMIIFTAEFCALLAYAEKRRALRKVN